MELMDTASLKRWRGYFFMALGTVLVLGVLFVFSRTVELSQKYGKWADEIRWVSAAGVIILAVLLVRRMYLLVRDYRAHVPGSRLAARMATIFGILAVVPLLVVYLFALSFLSRGIESWFTKGLGRGLRAAMEESRLALEQRQQDQGRHTVDLAGLLGGYSHENLVLTFDSERRASGALGLLVVGQDGNVEAASVEEGKALPDPAQVSAMLAELNPGEFWAETDSDGADGFVIDAAALLPEREGEAGTRRVLMARYQLEPGLAGIANAVRAASDVYGQTTENQSGLMSSFILTLTLVLLLAMLSAIYLAIRAARRLTRPVHDLIEGTRAVGKGDFGMRLALPSRDEMGYLVSSFNDMTKRLRRASEETLRSRAQVEAERERLAVILAGLSTGVMVIDTARRIVLANAAADAILGTPMELRLGIELDALEDDSPRLAAFAAAVTRLLDGGGADWQEEFTLPQERVLRCACAPLVHPAGGESGHVLVFDDITHMQKAQRDAAWGEVARRLAHEIKNPLTPIQLAAERLRRRLAGKLDGEEAELLERATHTIVQQVESLKGMVNAFSDYARAPDLKLMPVDLNELVSEAAELYRAHETRASIEVHADADLPMIQADRGRMRQVLNNLITNALEALEGVAEARIVVSTRYNAGPEGGTAVIMVSDNGHGFDEEMLARVFEPYVTGKPRGTGLGLAIVKKIAEEHGGSIEANNRPEGGAFVRVVLPLAARDEAAQPARGIA
jgi:nitrogen fixation/metabolism regulation signal transduction histidine kinase